MYDKNIKKNEKKDKDKKTTNIKRNTLIEDGTRMAFGLDPITSQANK
jgi:hypothetical protein